MSELRDVAARGARIRFATEARASGAPPLLALHDVLADRSSFARAIPLLAERLTVIAPDLPGFGESEKPSPNRFSYTHDAFGEALFDLVASLGLSRVSVCGHGLGAAIAVMLAARHPTLIDRVVLVSPSIYEPAHGVVARVATLPVLGPFLFTQLLGKSVFRRHFRPALAPERLEALYGSFTEPAARAAAHATLASMRDPRPVIARLPSLRAPALVIGGAEHAPFLTQGKRLAREIGGRYEVLECGHCPHEEQPEDFAKRALDFLLEPRKTSWRAA